MLNEMSKKEFTNGCVYALKTDDDYLVEVTDTFLPYYTKDAVGRKQNKLDNYNVGDRSERWMIGVSCMSGCPIRCKFCATGKMKKFRNLNYTEILDQIRWVINRNKKYNPLNSQEFKINYTRMGEPFLNINNIKEAILILDSEIPNTHHYISTIGVRDSDFSWIKGNITLQISLHSLDEKKRDWLIPYKKKMSIEELGQIRTNSNLKTTINLTLVDESDFDIDKLNKYFDPDYFFIKLSPINKNECSDLNGMGNGIIKGINLI